METIRVNMTPCDEVKTIHASQNDGEAREWGFELHNNGEKIDSSSISDQMVFKAYEGGTEEILPENGSTPTTSPIIADIKYRQGLLTDQEFLYRESPAIQDGLARIDKIKGNTLKWNQLVKNGNFADTSNWSTYSSSFTVSGNIATIVGSGNNANINQTISCVSGHKYYAKADLKGNTSTRIIITGTNLSEEVRLSQSANYETVGLIFTVPTSTLYFNISQNGSPITFYAKNVMLFDLTQMGLDISSPSDFTSLFPLSYYSYNQGSLLSFNGNGIKTVGFNQWDEQYVSGYYARSTGNFVSANNQLATKNKIYVMPNTQYYLGNSDKLTADTTTVLFYSHDNTYIGSSRQGNGTFTTPSNCSYIHVNFGAIYGTTYKNDLVINVSSSENGTYESYTESTLSLPISTYFPTGMKDAPDGNGGKIYDELTNSKAITRVGSRAYQSGDESDTSVITDGTTTYYALATPTETPITTASLVTENAEIPLSNNDGVLIGKCTEELSAEPGFHDAKIKLSDSDGECYSNKIQLHVERSPQ